ncbi:MAG: NCS2 family permease [Leptolyngbyaceae cyanobacterium bins.302]|nr:NCS2 family permease [Leptolyngbyaceae cyanobacterium bins.302]
MVSAIAKFFKFNELQTNFRTEILAGVTTFVTLSSVLVVNPAILSSAIYLKQPGDLLGELLVATAISSALSSILLACMANYPFALAPAMGPNAYLAFSVILGLPMNWRLALSTVFLESVLFLVLIATNLHTKIIRAIPASFKYATVVGIGLFIAYLGLAASPEPPTLGAGIIVPDAATVTALGSLRQPPTLMAIFGFLLTAILLARSVKGAMLWGILSTAMLGWIFGIAPTPQGIFALPTLPINLFGQAIAGFKDLNAEQIWNLIAVTLTLLFVTLFGFVGTLTGLGQQLEQLDEKGNLPRLTQTLSAGALGGTLSSLIGMPPPITYLESAAGITEGGRSGFTSIVVAVLMLGSAFFVPVVAAIPTFAITPALILVGVLMMRSVQEINWDDPAEALSSFLIILMMPLTFSLAKALAIGFVVYPIMKAAQGKFRDVSWVIYALAIAAVFYLGSLS